MAEFLIKASDAPVEDSPGKWYAALIVTVVDDGHEWGNSEGLPKFYRINVPGILAVDAQAYLEEWRHNTSVAILSSDSVTDSYRLRVTTDRVSASGKNAFSASQIETFFTDWGATGINIKPDSVTFDVSIYNAITSRRFWGADVSGTVFVETTYNAGSGDHLIQIQDSPFSDAQMKFAIEENGGMVTSADSFVMNRSVARERLTEDIETRIKVILFSRRRWYVTAAGISALQAAGGIITVTPAQFINNISDGLDD